MKSTRILVAAAIAACVSHAAIVSAQTFPTKPGTLGSPAHPIKAGSLYRYALVAYGM